MFDSLGRIPAPMRSQITTPPENSVTIMAIARRERNGSDAVLSFMPKPLSSIGANSFRFRTSGPRGRSDCKNAYAPLIIFIRTCVTRAQLKIGVRNLDMNSKRSSPTKLRGRKRGFAGEFVYVRQNPAY